MTLWRELSPVTMTTSCRRTLRSSAKSFMHCSFAAPSTGGEVSRIFTAPFTMPVTPHFDARGWTWTAKVTPSALSLTEINSNGSFTGGGEHLAMGIQERLERRLELLFLAA